MMECGTIECEIGVEGAKRVGIMLERNASLMKLKLYSARPLIHSRLYSSIMIKCALLADVLMFTHGKSD
jgi:hypothetical protein